MSYRVELDKAASEELCRIPKNQAKRIVEAISLLGDEPSPDGCKKLSGTKGNFYRIRIGDYRVWLMRFGMPFSLSFG